MHFEGLRPAEYISPNIVGSDLARRPSEECSEASSDIIDAASASLYM